MRLPHSRCLRRAVLASIVGAAAGGLFAAASAVAAGGTISVAPTTVGAGHTVVISGSVPTAGAESCAAVDPAILTSVAALFPPDGTGPQATRTSSGAFRVEYAVPKTTPAGIYRIGLRCGGGSVGIHAVLRVMTAVPSGPGSTTPSEAGTILVAPARVRAGHAVVISGTVPTAGAKACPASETPILTSTAALFPPDGFGPNVARDPSGAFRVRYPVPRATPADTYRIGLRCGGGNLGIHATLRVTTQARQVPSSAPPAGQGGAGASIGDNTPAGWYEAGWLAAGLAAGALAVALGVAAWRRRQVRP